MQYTSGDAGAGSAKMAADVDEEVVVNGNLVSSRKPDDIPAFNRTMIDLFGRARGGVRRSV